MSPSGVVFNLQRCIQPHGVSLFAQLAFIMRIQPTYTVLFEMLCEFSALGLSNRLHFNGSSSEQTIVRQKTAEGEETQPSPLPQGVSMPHQSVPQLWLGSNQDPRPFKVVYFALVTFPSKKVMAPRSLHVKPSNCRNRGNGTIETVGSQGMEQW